MSAEDDDIMAQWAAALGEQDEAEKKEAQNSADDDLGASDGGGKSRIIDGSTAEAEKVPYEDFGEATPISKEEKRRLDAILDIPVIISMEVGRSQISIRNLLQLNQGSVIELERVAGEPLDVLVNGTLIAHGEVVVVNDKFGIRLTDVISQTERIKKLK
ncbi:MAG: flagellar motor switch protein FliN [Succinivibrionaceae bacterium]|nr:flagellar motor switch protein FliN [Succinivibrionaceae bacterium]